MDESRCIVCGNPSEYLYCSQECLQQEQEGTAVILASQEAAAELAKPAKIKVQADIPMQHGSRRMPALPVLQPSIYRRSNTFSFHGE